MQEAALTAMIVKAIFEGGVPRLQEPVELEGQKQYLLLIEPAVGTAPSEDDDDPTGWNTARRFIGLWKDAPATDLAENHDKYVYDRR